nr:hypothetical protein [Clostridia bacterium]
MATDLDWDGRNSRVYFSAEPAFTRSGGLFCEVPFGLIERGDPTGLDYMGLTDEWPSLGFAGVSDGKTSLAVIKSGLPATKLTDGVIRISLLRSVTSDNPTYAGTNDPGRHCAAFALSSWSGDFASGDPAKRAKVFNTRGLTYELGHAGADTARSQGSPDVKDPAAFVGKLSASLPDDLILSAFKLSCDGKNTVVRIYESSGKAADLDAPEGVRLVRCDSLERPINEAEETHYPFRPFEIATFRIVI